MPRSVLYLDLYILDNIAWVPRSVSNCAEFKRCLNAFSTHTQLQELKGLFNECIFYHNQTFQPLAALARILPVLRKTTARQPGGEVGWFEIQRNRKTVKPHTITRYKRSLYEAGGFYAPCGRTIEEFLS
ncbi:hypothetical protein M422DRAFT_39645 [Sphaerobolus stellatus SS14]|uniref:Uncharacterized protein n=1 Tax=Sphaerobolus stellatus (strain SS14) TaxID=990650 RepID=A0A0C9UD87_SPHS4|nr:hypothetical protein M422DRAFT_39645 [Sphaerobolus stellatus SS14]